MSVAARTITNDERLATAVQEYFQTYFEGLYRYAFTILKNNHDARDAVQTVFVKLWEKRAVIDTQQPVQAYLYTSIYNYCLNVKRNEKVRDKYIRNYTGPGYEHHDELVSKENLQAITAALDSLPPQCKLIFYKSRFEKKKYAAIAQELQLSVKTVEAQIGKALKLLREKLADVPVLLLLLLTLL